MPPCGRTGRRSHDHAAPPISTEADSKVIVPRRNFLIRALGFTAAGASMVLPVVALQSPEERIAHHFKELEAARRLGTRWGAAYRGGRRSGIFVECDLPHTGEAPKAVRLLAAPERGPDLRLLPPPVEVGATNCLASSWRGFFSGTRGNQFGWRSLTVRQVSGPSHPPHWLQAPALRLGPFIDASIRTAARPRIVRRSGSARV